MSQIRFDQATLWITPRSPFARRVRLAFLESQITYQEKITDIFNPSAELLAINPVARVPILQFKSGEVLMESHLILQAFYENVTSPLLPKSEAERLNVFFWSALGTGLAEKTVEFYLDSIRPKGIRDPEVAEELNGMMSRILARLDAYLAKNQGPWICGPLLTQADLDLGTGLTYLSLRYTTEWKNRYEQVARYLERLESRPSFVQTLPPPA